jgi:RNA polymerase sigma factor (sigma-70 family)
MDNAIESIRSDIAGLLPRLRRFGRAITRNAEDADDLVQMAVERALMRVDQWRQGTRLDSWIFTIMKNAWIDETRSRARRNQLFVAEEEGERVGVCHTEQQISAMEVQKAIAQLPDEQRLAIGLVLVEGLPYKDAAEVLQIPIGTLTSRLARGREALQAILSSGEARPKVRT